jgi:hypothetical protein
MGRRGGEQGKGGEQRVLGIIYLSTNSLPQYQATNMRSGNNFIFYAVIILFLFLFL